MDRMGTPGNRLLVRERRIQEFRDPALSSEKNITQDKKCLSYGFTDHRFFDRFMDTFQDKCGLTRPAGPNLVTVPFENTRQNYI